MALVRQSAGTESETIADLEGSTNVQAQHVSEAVQYRLLDRKW